MKTTPSFLIDEQARAAIVLWASGQFDTSEIADVLGAREDAVYRTLHLAKDGARQDAVTGVRGAVLA